ncbi:MAG: ribbon-helix-helix protein, CopG family [Chloroflexota bacterium]
MAERVRVSLDVTPEMKEIIDSLAERSGTTQADVLRRAVALFKVVKDAGEKGEAPALVNTDGEVTTKIVGI